jgi:hypothetical protein
MIINALMYLSLAIVNTVLLVFPNSAGLPAEVGQAFQWIGGYVGILDPIIPIPTLATILSLVISLELFIFGFRTFRWLISHLPFVGGKG